MDTITLLQHYWWLIISLLGALLVFLMFVQGGQALLYTIGRTEEERNMLVNSLGRKWEFTFTTLVTFGGAFFASFPLFYSTSFGGAFYVWMAILLCFVIQAVAYEYRRKPGNVFGERTFNAFLLVNGVLGPLLIGTAVGTFFTGAEFTVDRLNLANQGGAAVISGLLIAMVLPESPSRKAGSLASLPVILKRPALRQLYFIAAVAMLGNFTVYSYVSPIVTEAAGGSLETVVTLLLVFGLSGFIGTIVNTRLLEANTSLAVVLPLSFLTLAFLFFLPTASLPWIHWPLIVLWGASLTGLMMALNNLVLAAGHDAADISSSMLSGIINVGIGGGAFLGSILSSAWSFASLPYAGAILAGGPLLMTLLIWKTTGAAILPYDHEESVRDHGQPLDLESGRAAKTE